jgi:hypothetical protein
MAPCKGQVGSLARGGGEEKLSIAKKVMKLPELMVLIWKIDYCGTTICPGTKQSIIFLSTT